MGTFERYPMKLEDESDSDAEEFIAPVPPVAHNRLRAPDSGVGSSSQKACPKEARTGSANKGGERGSKTDDVLKKSVVQPGFEQLDTVPKGGSRAMQKKINRLERAKTTGKGWFNMKAPEMTDEVKQNLEVLKMRGAINKNRVYKNSDMRALPKYFAMGTVIEHAADFYSSRIPKKDRRKTLVEELMADVEAKKQLKKQATKIAVKRQLKAQNQFPKKKKPSKRRMRDMD